MQRVDTEDLKRKVFFIDLIRYYGYKVNRSFKIPCPFHKDKTPSFHVYEERGKCFGCSWSGDIIQFVIDQEQVEFLEAVKLISQWFGLLKDESTEEKAPTKPRNLITEKKVKPESVSLEIVDHYHNALGASERLWLRENRLLRSDTIDFHRIGLRNDQRAFSIPFWKGVPRHSGVDILQFRGLSGERKGYWGLKNYNHPSLIGRFTINPDFLVVFIGTLDCVLAIQDGIPSISPNGVSAWINNLEELKWIVGSVKNLFLVPDNTTSELIDSYKLANALGATVKFLPDLVDGKDYTDYRHQFTAKQFMEEVIEMKSPFVEDGDHVKNCTDILEFMASGECEKAIELLEILELTGYAWYSVNHKLQCKASFHPFPTMSDSQWQTFIERMELAHTFGDMARAVCQTAEEVTGTF